MSVRKGATKVFGKNYSYNGAGNEIMFPCPECQGPEVEEEFKLYVNLSTGGSFCQRCGYKIYVDVEGFAHLPRIKKPLMLLDDLNPSKVSGGPAMEYLLSRGLTEAQVDYYGFMTPDNKWYGGGVICPVREEIYKGFQMRLYDRAQSKKWDKLHPDVTWWSCPGFKRRSCLWNLAFLGNQRRIVVSEAVFSGISCGYDAIATFGKDISQGQLFRILEAAQRMKAVIIWCLDGGNKHQERSKSWQYAEWMQSLGQDSKVANLPEGQDPNEIGYWKTQDYLEDAANYTQMKHMQLKLEWLAEAS